MEKIKLKVKKENIQKYTELLEKADFMIDETAELTLYEEGFYIDYLIGKKDNAFFNIPINDVIYIQSYGHDIYLKTIKDEYKIKETLKQLEYYLDEKIFIRISSSLIINIKTIKSISPTLGMKFKIVLSNNEKVIVNRTYYYKFADRFNL